MKFELAEEVLVPEGKKTDIELIRERIKLFGIKQRHIASKLEIHENHLSQILIGNRVLTSDLRSRIFTYLGISQ